MSAADDADLCRVTVVGPARRADLALPGYVPFAELFPVVARYAGLEGPQASAEAGGWVLQRLGRPPFDPATTPQQAGLRNGETIYLRPYRAQLPPAAFDDVADAIAAGVAGRPGRWDPRAARWVALGAGITALLAGLALTAAAGPPWQVPLLVSGASAVALLLAVTALARAFGDGGAAVPLGYLAVGYAFLAGLLGPARPVALAHLGGPQLLSGFAAATLAGVLAATATGRAAAYLGSVLASLAGAVGSGVDMVFGRVGGTGAVALTAVATLMLVTLIPMVSFRLARMPLPAVPRDTEDLRTAPDVDATAVPAAAAMADRFVTSAVAGIALVAGIAEAVLAVAGPPLGAVMCAVLALTLLLRARMFGGLAQRLWLLVPGFGGEVLAIAAAARFLPPALALVLTVAVLAAGAALTIGTGLWLPAHRLSPVWGRAGDIAEILLIVILVPLALAVAGVFGALPGLAG